VKFSSRALIISNTYELQRHFFANPLPSRSVFQYGWMFTCRRHDRRR